MRSGKFFSFSFIHLSLLFTLLLAPGKGKKAFKNAMTLFEKQKFTEAKIALREFIIQYPESPHQPDALFASARLIRVPERTIAIYQDILSRYPESPVADDALYMIGQYYDAKGNLSKAKETYEALLRKYPESNRLSQTQESLNWLNDLMVQIPDSFSPSTSAPHELSPSEYTIQVGSFENVLDAHRLRERLIQKGYSVSITHALIEGKTFHRVRVGVFATRNEAFQFGEILIEKEDLPAWVVIKD